MPELSVGKTYVLKMRNTCETAGFTIREMLAYKGCAVLYGQSHRHGIVVGPGSRTVPPRDACPVFVPNGNAHEVEQFCLEIGGGLVGLVFREETSLINIAQTAVPEGEHYYPVLNTPLPCWFGPKIEMYHWMGMPRPVSGQKDKMLELGRATVDLWLQWKANGQALSAVQLFAKEHLLKT